MYYDFEKSQHQCQGILRDPLLYSRQEVVPSLEFGTNICDEVHPLDYPIGFAVADMSCCQYLLGEGYDFFLALSLGSKDIIVCDYHLRVFVCWNMCYI